MSVIAAKADLRAELPRPIPDRIKRLYAHRGYPVPWFVAWIVDGEPVGRGNGEPDFRVLFPGAVQEAIRGHRCWICGGQMKPTSVKTFVIGPMCAVNRNNAEPPSHFECADWSARACPFLSRPHMRRNEKTKPTETQEPPGIAIMRNPGVACVWSTRHFSLHRDPRGGLLFDIGEPTTTSWYREGRPATRAEVMESVNSGLPFLMEYVHSAEDKQALDQQMLLLERTLPKQ